MLLNWGREKIYIERSEPKTIKIELIVLYHFLRKTPNKNYDYVKQRCDVYSVIIISDYLWMIKYGKYCEWTIKHGNKLYLFFVGDSKSHEILWTFVSLVKNGNEMSLNEHKLIKLEKFLSHNNNIQLYVYVWAVEMKSLGIHKEILWEFWGIFYRFSFKAGIFVLIFALQAFYAAMLR